MILASIDVGTNSIRLLISEFKNSALFDIVRKVKITQLGAGMDKNKLISEDALNRTLNVLKEYKKIIDKHKIYKYLVVGTSALRECKNSKQFIEIVKKVSNLKVKIKSGEDEAYYSFLGATHQFNDKKTRLVVDIGGGSTELILGKPGKIKLSYSLPIGCIRLTEKHLLSDPPNKEQIKNSFIFLESILRNSLKKISDFDIYQIIGLGGTISALVSIKQKLKKHNFNKIHLFKLKIEDIEKIFERLSKISLKERKEVIGLEEKRADTVLGGTIILLSLLRIFKKNEIIISQRDMLDGIIYSLI